MSDTNNNALVLCKRYIECVESKDISGVEETLAEDAQQIFRHTKQVTEPGMFDEVSSGERKGVVVAVLKGKSEVLAYTKGLMSSFRKIKWIDTKWKVSESGREVYFSGKGDLVTENSGKPYQNVYVTRFDVYEGRIIEINEISDAMLYMGLGIAPNAAQLRAFGHALLRPFGIGAHSALEDRSMAKTASTAWVLPIAEAQIGEFRKLLADLNEDLSGLATRAYDIGYHRERMWLQPNDDGSALLIIYLEFDEGVSFAEFAVKLKSYESEFTRWWTPRFERFGIPKSVGEQLLSWDGNK